MAKVQKPSVSPEMIGQRPKKKSPVEDFAGTLAVQAGKTLGSNQPARTASAEGQNQRAAIVGAAHGLGRRSPHHSLSPSLEGPLSGKPAEVLAVRSANNGIPTGALPTSSTSPAVSGRPVASDSQVRKPASGATGLIQRSDRPVAELGSDKPVAERPELQTPGQQPVRETRAERDPLTLSGSRAERRRPQESGPEFRLEKPTPLSPPVSPDLLSATNTNNSSPLAAAAPARLTNATPLTPLQQVAQLIISRSPESTGQVKAEMTLYPEHLGTIQVQLSVDASGVLSAAISASSDAIAALSPSLSDLRSALQDSGLNLANLDLQSNDSGRQSDRDENISGSRSVLTLAPEEQVTSTAALIDGGEIVDVIL